MIGWQPVDEEAFDSFQKLIYDHFYSDVDVDDFAVVEKFEHAQNVMVQSASRTPHTTKWKQISLARKK